MIGNQHKRSAFATERPRARKRTSGAATAVDTPLAVRTTGVAADAELRSYVRERLGFKLGKFAKRVERATVRFEDVNGPRGGVDIACRLKVVLSGLASVVVEDVAAGPYEAFDRAGDRVERAVRRTLDRAQRSGARRGRRHKEPSGWQRA